MLRSDVEGVLSFECSYWSGRELDEPPVYPYCEEEVDRILPYKNGPYRSSFLLFSVLLSGSIHYTIEGEDYLMHAGEAMIIPMDSLYAQESITTGGAYCKLVLEIRGAVVPSYAAALHLDRVGKFQVPDLPEVQRRFRKIGELMRNGEQESRAQAIAQTHYLMTQFAYWNSRQAQSTPELFLRIREAIENSINAPFSSEKLRQITGASHSTMDRLMRRYQGVSCMEYYLNRKMVAAEYLLQNTELSIKEIAFRLGCSSQFHFSNLFQKRHHGISPREYRKRLLEHQRIDATTQNP